MVLLVASLVLFYVAFGVLLSVEGQAVPADGHSAALTFGFETISALGTVGLSTGVTPALSTTGKGVLIALMIVGRLGPLAVIAAWAHRPTPRPYTHPEEPLPVG